MQRGCCGIDNKDGDTDGYEESQNNEVIEDSYLISDQTAKLVFSLNFTALS